MILGGLFGFFFLTVLHTFYKIRGIEGPGGGDISSFVWDYIWGEGIILNIFMSCFLGSIVGILIILKFKIKISLLFCPFIISLVFCKYFFQIWF